jgi:hypothetical protein
MAYIVTCNGVRYTMPMLLSEAEAYRKMRLGDRKNHRIQGERKYAPENLTHGARQKWEVVEA